MADGSSGGAHTAALVEYALGMDAAALPAAVASAGRAILLDTLGAMLGACAPSVTVTAPLLRYARAEGGLPCASIVGHDVQLGPSLAALVNGTLAYALDIESIHGPSITHAAAVVVPAALAVAEATGAAGAELLAAIVVGLDAADRVSRAVAPRAMYDRGFHPSSVAGTPAAALAAARLLRLDTEAAHRALGLAATQASGLMAWEHDPTEHARPFNCGIAARNGVTAALLAAQGFGGPPGAFEGAEGLLMAFGDGRTDAAILSEALGERFAATETSIKRFACCAFLQPGVNAVVDACLEHSIQAADVEAIELHFPRGGAAVIDDNPVRSHSAQYVLAVALLDGDVTFGDLAVDRRNSEPALAAISRNVRVIYSDELDPEFPDRFTSRAVIALRDGRPVQSLVTYPTGHPRNPLSPAALRAKFDRLASPVAGQAALDEIAALVDRIDSVTSTDRLMSLLRLAVPSGGRS